MKVTVVPAQVTTVEDRIIGNLGFSQMMLLIVPVFVGAGLFAVLPPAMGSSVYKYVILGILAFICCILAIRIKGKILAFWIITIVRYNLRPKFYLFNKNTVAHREVYELMHEQKEDGIQSSVDNNTPALPNLDFREAVKVYATIENPATNLRFETTKKGGLSVRFTEVKE